MSTLFISHASQDSAKAVRVVDWLRSQGWADVFLDLDPTQGLAPGLRWQEELKRAGETCAAVLLLVSHDWVASYWCRTEFLVADQLGKRIFPVLIEPTPFEALPVELRARYQLVDISTPDQETEGFARLRIGLMRAGLDPKSFEWPPPGDPHRSVYRGLSALDTPDAAIFFGRDAQITLGLDRLRLMRGGAPERMLVILGASGAGKSSFLRAGLLARLQRDEENYLVLPVVRPGAAALTGPEGLYASLGRAGVTVRPTDPESLAAALGALRAAAAGRIARGEAELERAPAIVLPLDQAEELFGAENSERAAFCGLLAGLIERDRNVIVVATIRSDAYQALQAEPALAGVRQSLFSLPPIVAGAFQEIILGPARLARPPIEVEPELTQALLTEIETSDALPLLAVTMERLQTQFGRSGKLRLADYRETLGGVGGAIQASVVAAIGLFPDAATLALARRLFIPAMVQVGPDGVKRRTARREDIPAEAQALADRFVAQRLLAIDRREADGGAVETIEITHEAILRHWPALAAWVAEEQDALRGLEGVRAAAQDWEAHARHEAWLNHDRDRLTQAAGVAARKDFAAVIDAPMRAYLAACQARARRALFRRRALQALAAIVALPLLAIGALSVYDASVRPLIARYLRYAPYARTAASLAAQPAGATFQDCRAGAEDCPAMVVLPAGRFLMGAPASDATADPSERPQHAVSIRRFAVSRNDVTFAEWQACVDAGGCARNRDPDNSGWGKAARPVINISWKDAQDYAAWLSKVTGQPYRLLSEAEWEYAARAGTTSAYFWGDAVGAAHADCTGCGSRWDGKATAPVGSFAPNAFGLNDMAGEVWQYVADCASASYAGAPADGSAWTGGDCSYRGVRGGSWRSVPSNVTAFHRDKNSPTDRDDSNGFHIARSL